MNRPKGYYSKCTADNCERAAATKLYCVMHYKRFKRNGTTERVINAYTADDVCSFCAASGPLSNHLCHACWQRKWKKGYVERDVAKAGEGCVNTQGYHVDTVNGQRVYSHRVAAEYYLGRALQPDEVVHHKDGNRLNNTKENLEVLASQSEHMKLHRQKGAQ